jgi:hypothetical protein
VHLQTSFTPTSHPIPSLATSLQAYGRFLFPLPPSPFILLRRRRLLPLLISPSRRPIPRTASPAAICLALTPLVNPDSSPPPGPTPSSARERVN